MNDRVSFPTDPPAAQSGGGSRRRAGGRPRIKGTRITSVELNESDRELLETLAERDGSSFGDVWRSALRCYAEQSSVQPSLRKELSTAA